MKTGLGPGGLPLPEGTQRLKMTPQCAFPRPPARGRFLLPVWLPVKFLCSFSWQVRLLTGFWPTTGGWKAQLGLFSEKFLCCQLLGLAGLQRGIERMFHHAGRTMVVLAQEAPAQNPGPAAEILGSPLFMFGLLGLMFWFMILRPQNRKRREHEAELKKLKVHDRIVTAGGILGTVVEVTTDSDELTIRIDEANNTRMRILRSAIARKVTDSAV